MICPWKCGSVVAVHLVFVEFIAYTKLIYQAITMAVICFDELHPAASCPFTSRRGILSTCLAIPAKTFAV